VDVVVNPDPDRGLASSLKAGLRELPANTDVVLVALADKPLVKPETIDQLLAVFDEGGAEIVYPVYRGEQGHPVLFASSLVNELTTVAGDRGAKAVVDAHRDRARPVEVDDPGVCFDIDTPEDYAAALERLSGNN
jgi:molybdenum cofactor cytidylyltransferase